MMSTDKFYQIAQDLEVYHGVFSQIWQMGKPIECKAIPTAAVMFDKNGGFFSFLFNPDFYASLDDYKLKFVICHEALHIILNHGKRSMLLNHQISNAAQDVVINEMLVKYFGFERNKISDADKYHWYNTTFKNNIQIEKDKSFEYYYDELMRDVKNNLIKIKIKLDSKCKSKVAGRKGNKSDDQDDELEFDLPQTVDEHGDFDEDTQQQIDQAIDDAIEKLNDDERKKLKEAVENALDEDTKDEIKQRAKQAGTSAGGLVKIMIQRPIKKKKKWETIINKWTALHMHRTDRDKDQWARKNRRYVTLPTTNVFLPTEMDDEFIDLEMRRIKVLFFLDTSGSCAHLAQRFFDAARSLPENRFDVELYCFDTKIYKTTLESGKIYGGGGTAFDIIEEYIQKEYPGKKYPLASFIVTDGAGTPVSPQFPERWYWFLSENYTQYIPKKSQIFKLADFE